MTALQERSVNEARRLALAAIADCMPAMEWGEPDTFDPVADGIARVTTPSHGGIILSPARNAKVPEYMRNGRGAYEEDCDWCIPFLVFPAEFRAFEGEDYLRHLGYARETLRGWHKDAAAIFLRPIASAMDARAIAHAVTEHSDKVAAANNWRDQSPAVRFVVEVAGGWDVLPQKPSLRLGNVILVSQGKEECA